MKPREMGVMWLRDRAQHLRRAANRADGAYKTGELARVCALVADRYRKAAVLLDDAATELKLMSMKRERDEARARVADLEYAARHLDDPAYELGRREERAAVVAWLRAIEPTPHEQSCIERWAPAIERGEHHPTR